MVGITLSSVTDVLKGGVRRTALSVASVLLVTTVIIATLMFWWSREPELMDVSVDIGDNPVIGEHVTRVAIRQMKWLLEKPGGLTVNDVLPPGLISDNMPEFEFGVVSLVRDWALTMRNDMSRSQTQSAEDSNILKAQILLNNDIDHWIFPAPEGKIEEAIAEFEQYLKRLKDGNSRDGQFFARADNLVDWLNQVNKRLGSLSDELGATRNLIRRNVDLAGDAHAEGAKAGPRDVSVYTPWNKVDDIFFKTRGYAWALLANLEAIKIDFRKVLEDKNAGASLDQIIRELRETQTSLTTPMIFWGTSGYGMLNNQSKALGSDVSRANAALIDLVTLLKDG